MDSPCWILQHIETHEDIKISQPLFQVGRARNMNIVCESINISRNHANFLTLQDGTFHVEDKNSSNGIYVNGIRVKSNELYQLHEGDEVGLGYHSKLEIANDNKYIYIVKKMLPVISNNAADIKINYNMKTGPNTPIDIKVSTTLSVANNEDRNKNVFKCHSDNVCVNTSELLGILESSQIDCVKGSSVSAKVPEVKKEIEESNVKKGPAGVNYKIEPDGCIIINSDDEDIQYPFSQSQENETNKKIRVDDNMFYMIKKEVEELDDVHGRLLNAVVVDDDSDSEGNNLDWLLQSNMNDNKPSTSKQTASANANIDYELKNSYNNINRHPPSSSKSSPSDTFHDNKNSDFVTKLNSKTRSSRVTTTKEDLSCGNVNKPLMLNQNVTNSLGKYQKRPTLEKSNYKSRVAPVNGEVNNKCSNAVPGKRKQTEQPKSSKRMKSQKNNDWLGKSSSRTSIEEKEELNELRKQRLKEIAAKAQEGRAPKVKIIKPTNVKVKVSEGRGKFLTEIPRTSLSDKSKKSIKNPSSTITTSHLNEEQLKYVEKLALQSNSVAVKNEGIVNAIESPIKVENHKKNQSVSSFMDILIQVLQYDTSNWVRCTDEGSPKFNLIKMEKSFANYSEYYTTVLPFLLLEMWTFLYQEFQLNRYAREIFRTKIEEERKLITHSELMCLTYVIRDKDSDLNQVKQDDIIMFQYYFSSGGKELVYPVIGYVSEVYKRNLREYDVCNVDLVKAQGIKPDIEIRFKLLIKLIQGETDIERIPMMQCFTNVVTSIRVFKALKYLEYSSLCGHILHPDTRTYRIPKQHRKPLFSKANLNESQNVAVMEATHVCLRNIPGIYLIQGPPGTGKTSVIINIILQVLLNNEDGRVRILVVAPSNAAVDELVRKLLDAKLKLSQDLRNRFKLVRMGRRNAIHDSVQNYSLYELTKKNFITVATSHMNKDDQTQVIQLKHELRKLGQHNRSKFETEQMIKLKRAEIDSICRKTFGHQHYEKYRECENNVLDKASVICTTLSSCGIPQMKRTFLKKVQTQCCIIDECTQSTEQESFTPLNLGINKLILVGDPKQLPPFTVSQDAKVYGHGLSLFSRIMSNFENKPDNPIKMLNIQYRMHPAICQLPSQMYYNNALQTDPSLMERTSVLSEYLQPYIVFSLCNKNINNQEHTNNQEYTNKSEIDCIIKILDAINWKIKNESKFSVGIITPYNEQKHNIIETIHGKIHNANMSVSVNTVDSFQGQEKDVIIISYVRDTSNNFVSDQQRLNVSLTRAKYACYILGSTTLFQSGSTLNKIYEDARQRNVLRSIDSKTNNALFLSMISL